MRYIHLNPLRANLVTRLDHHAWTSHREYLGADPPPDWLITNHFLEILGGADRLHDYVLGLHQGAIDWPDELALRTGWIVEQKQREKGRPTRRHRSTAGTRFRKPVELIRDVCAVTGSSRAELRTTVMGPRANPARRLAVWALDRYTTLTHGEISAQLDMTTRQVANVLARISFGSEPLASWKVELISMVEE